MAALSNNYIYRRGATPITSLLNTQRVRVFGYDVASPGKFAQIGLIQTWNPSDSRAIEPHRGIGFGDTVAELGVGSTDHTASCSIMMMYLRDIMQVFGYKANSVTGLIRSLAHHRWPFDVREDIAIPDPSAGGDNEVVTTIYEGCWMTDYSKAFNIGETATTQDTTLQITDVHAPEVGADGELETSYISSNNAASLLYAGGAQQARV